MEDKLFKFVQKNIKEITGKDAIMYDTDFVKDLGLSSFDIMNLVCIFEEQFDIEIANRDIWHIHQVRDVIQYLMKKDIQEGLKDL